MRGIGLFSDPRATLGARTITRRKLKSLGSAERFLHSSLRRVIEILNREFLCRQTGAPGSRIPSRGHWRRQF